MKSFQKRVHVWLLHCFGKEIAHNTTERNHRFLEESLELVQSLGCTRSEALQLVDYVFDRPPGEPHQEIGGAIVTLTALCAAHGFILNQCAETELERIWNKIDMIREKQAKKPKHSPLPQQSPPLELEQLVDEEADRLYPDVMEKYQDYSKYKAFKACWNFLKPLISSMVKGWKENVEAWETGAAGKGFEAVTEYYKKEVELYKGQVQNFAEQVGILRRQLSELENWKQEAIAVTPPLQEIAKALGLKLGVSIHDKILPAILSLQYRAMRLNESSLLAKARVNELETELAQYKENEVSKRAEWVVKLLNEKDEQISSLKETTERKIRVLKSALTTISLEAKEPIIKVYAQSALDETVDIPEEAEPISYCAKHKWFGVLDEKCPICFNLQTNKEADNELHTTEGS